MRSEPKLSKSVVFDQRPHFFTLDNAFPRVAKTNVTFARRLRFSSIAVNVTL
ncbi:hypothetical protein RND71_005776 [Anisodus tanguticus]|uniref:Uncharacterized protein n=1 Tax=Anisodus tanguticus TaxID=243964 RepID=A0AAE1VV93_9SOLA|nr:hypothetical protein RND71_005776 [Anisodus tanguticus]